MFNIGGVGGIRTHARDKPSNDLAILQLAIYTVFLSTFSPVYTPLVVLLAFLEHYFHLFFSYCLPLKILFKEAFHSKDQKN